MNITRENKQAKNLQLHDLDAGDLFMMPSQTGTSLYIAMDQTDSIMDEEGTRVRALEVKDGYAWRSEDGDEDVLVVAGRVVVDGVWEVDE